MNLLLSSLLSRKLTFWLKKLRRWLRPSQVLSDVGTAQGLGAVYVINLDRQPARWQHLLREARRQRVASGRTLADFCHRLTAVDGRQLRVADVPATQLVPTYPLRAQYYADPDPRLLPALQAGDPVLTMTQPEMAVALSHVAAWRQLLADDQAYALILEDDVFFESSFARVLPQLWQELPADGQDSPKFDLLYLSYREVDCGAEWAAHSPHLRRPVRGLWWFSGYVLSRAGAAQLLARLPIVGPVDLWINLQFAHLRVYAATPSLIFQRNDLASDNAYSILPFLSQLGIQADQTHAELQQRKGRGPVFVLDAPAASLGWLATALGVLGYRCCLADNQRVAASVLARLVAREPLLFDAYLGVAGLAAQRQVLAQRYPAAVFLTVADPGSPMSGMVGRFGRCWKTKDRVGTAGNHLHLPAEPADWGTLCRFLRCPVPPFGLPRPGTLPREPAGAERDVSLVPGAQPPATYPEHDVTPWVIPLAQLPAFGLDPLPVPGTRSAGRYTPLFDDELAALMPERWRLLTDSFPANRAIFTPQNFLSEAGGGRRLVLRQQRAGTRHYTAASLVSQAAYRYGRFEVRLKPARLSGVVTAFFLHRNDPWQEIDLEFLGRDTTRVLLNVYYNPGSTAEGWNYGNRGTPVLVELGFDAADDFHTYAVEWEPHEIRWLADDSLLHVRPTWTPTPVPELPMQLFINLWPHAQKSWLALLPTRSCR